MLWYANHKLTCIITCLWNYVIKKEFEKHSCSYSLSPKMKARYDSLQNITQVICCIFPANKFARAHADNWCISMDTHDHLE